MNEKAPGTYAASIARLRELVDRLESAQVDVDELENLMRESVELVAVCRTRLRSTQASVDTLLAGLHQDVKPAPAADQVP
jgi:exodeoxyribonuclease VII small subunit